MSTQKKFAQRFMGSAIDAVAAQVKPQLTQSKLPEPPRPKPESSTARPSTTVRTATPATPKWRPPTPESTVALPSPSIAAPEPKPSLSQRLDLMSEVLREQPLAKAYTPTPQEWERKSVVPYSTTYSPDITQSARLSQTAAALELQIKQVKAAAKETAQPGSSSYLTGGSPTPSSIPYAAALQYEPWDDETKAKLHALDQELARVETQLDQLGYDQRFQHLAELATRSTNDYTELERAEMRRGMKWLEQWIQADTHPASARGDFGNINDYTIDAYNLHRALRDKNPGAFVSGFYSFLSALPGVGAFSRHEDQISKERAQKEGLPSYRDYLPEEFTTLDGMKATHPHVSSVTKTAGDIMMMQTTANAIKSLPFLGDLSPRLRDILAYAGAMGGQEANNAATEGAEPLDIVRRGVIATAGGAVGGVASSAAEKIGATALKSLGLERATLPNALTQGLSGAVFSGGNMGTKALLDPSYRPSSDEIVYELGAPFLFFTLNSAIKIHAQNKAAKARLDYEAAMLKDDYARAMWNCMNGSAATEQTLIDLEARTQQFRNMLNNTQYIGHGKELKEALGALDLIDDQINAIWRQIGRSNSALTLSPPTPEETRAIYMQAMNNYADTQLQARITGEAGPLVERMHQARNNAKLARNTRDKYAQGFADYEAAKRRDQIVQVKDSGSVLSEQSEELKALAKRYGVEYNDTKRYGILQRYYTSVMQGKLSAMVDFTLYEDYYQKVQDRLIGQVVDDVEITGQTQHFLERVFGCMQDPGTGKPRTGVALEDVFDCIENPVKMEPIKIDKNGDRSFCVVGRHAKISINPDTGILIQISPRRWKNG